MDHRDMLERMVAASEEPILDDDDIDMLLTLSHRPDAKGNLPDANNWTLTYDLNFGAAEGWRIKAGRAAHKFNFSEDGQTFQRAQIYAHCVAQADRYGRMGMGSIPVGESSS